MSCNCGEEETTYLLHRLKLRTGEENDDVLVDCLDSAKSAILARRFPYGNYPDALESRYLNLQFRIALDLYNKIGAEGETAHTENGVTRSYESSWISEQLLQEVTPMVGVLG